MRQTSANPTEGVRSINGSEQELPRPPQEGQWPPTKTSGVRRARLCCPPNKTLTRPPSDDLRTVRWWFQPRDLVVAPVSPSGVDHAARSREDLPRWEEPLSTIQNTRLALA